MEPRGGAYLHEIVGSEGEVGEAVLAGSIADAEEMSGFSAARAGLRGRGGVLPEHDGELCGERVEERCQLRARHEVDFGDHQNQPGVRKLVGDRLLHGEAARVLRCRGRGMSTIASRASITSRITSLLLINCMGAPWHRYVRQRRAVVVQADLHGVGRVGGRFFGFSGLHLGNGFSASDRFFSRL